MSVEILRFFDRDCRPCHAIEPIVCAFALDHGATVRDVDVQHPNNAALLERYNVGGLPTLVVLVNGQYAGTVTPLEAGRNKVVSSLQTIIATGVRG